MALVRHARRYPTTPPAPVAASHTNTAHYARTDNAAADDRRQRHYINKQDALSKQAQRKLKNC
jgi:hypothetical protein